MNRPKVVAVMQPYFFPYAGYYRLLAAADAFVILDDVQFPRRGRVHRCEIPSLKEQREWLTLPLARQPRDTRICDLAFASDATAAFAQRTRSLPWLAAARGAHADHLRDHLAGLVGAPIDYLHSQLDWMADRLDLRRPQLRASGLGLDPNLKGQSRIMAIVEALGGEVYVNPSGGRSLYDHQIFARYGLTLKFLAPYEGPFRYLLPALAAGRIDEIAVDVRAQTVMVD